MRSIRRSIEACLLGADVLSSGCTQEIPAPIPAAHPDTTEPRRGGVVTVASFSDLRGLDPANISDGLAPQVLEAIFAGLVDYDANGKIVPDLAERWTVEDGGKTLRFYLHQGARFHDGEEVTADDVKRSVERALHPSAPNPSSSYFESLVGFGEFAAKKTETLEGVQVDGRYVVSFHLKDKDAAFLSVLALPTLRPVCKSAGTRYTDTWHPCGAGPFKLPPNGWERAREINVVRHEGYFRPGLPYLDGVRFLFNVNQTSQRFRFAHGEQDILRDFLAPDLLKFQADPRWKPFGEYEAELQIAGDAMNTEMPPFDNVEVRRAVAAAVNRDEIRLVRAANLNAANQPVPPGVFGHDDTLRGQTYDYEAALEHMRRAGYPYDPVTKTGGYPHVIPYIAYKQSLSEFVAQVLAQQLAKIGIRIEIRIVNYPTFLAIRGRRGQSAFGPAFWKQDYPDAGSILEPLFHSRSINDEDSNNWSFYKNPRVDELIDRARHELDDDKRKKIYVETQEILCDDAPWAFSYYYRYYTQRQPYVRNYHSHPMWTNDMTRVWVDRAMGPVAARAFSPENVLGSLLGRPEGSR
ncbi:ABC transporter substrate-binding protein [Labilithrix luteola]|uniref:ABC transporter substrate-binding protein n=1 Tax=Labilithrix luteola TaxID=1391654 RepID=UPI0011BAAD12|nr:ABC transporter substrate-binding protein [Labilithrix luteola]